MARLIATGLDEEVLKRFKQLVVARHGILRGYLGEELTKAIQLWIKNEGGESRYVRVRVPVEEHVKNLLKYISWEEMLE